MMIRRFMIASALLATGSALAGQTVPPARTPQLAVPAAVSPLPTTQALFDGYIAQDKMPGIVGAFGYHDLPTLFVSAGRISDDAGAAAAGPDTLWRVYSMTKPVTALAAMILIEQGKIGLDEPVSDFIPAFKAMRVQLNPDTLESRPAARPITIRNLLTHTAGLGYNIVTKGPLLKEYNRLGINPAALSAAMEGPMRAVRPPTLEAFADRVAQLPLIADPGTKWSYSIGLDVMGRVIEVASGVPFDQFVQTRIFDPLAMRSSYWTVPQSEVGRFATNYFFIGDGRAPIDPAASSAWLSPPSFPYGGAGLVMSARDYDRFLHLLQNRGTLDGVQIIKPETAALMMSNLLPPGVTFTPADVTLRSATEAPTMGFGAGGFVAIADKPGGPGKGTYGWSGAAGTIAWVDPEKRLRGTIMVNYLPPEKWPVRAETIAALITDLGRYKQ